MEQLTFFLNSLFSLEIEVVTSVRTLRWLVGGPWEGVTWWEWGCGSRARGRGCWRQEVAMAVLEEGEQHHSEAEAGEADTHTHIHHCYV